MLTSTTASRSIVRARPSYATFPVAVARIEQRSESFVRVTFTGDALGDFGLTGFDQRIKVILPLPKIGVDAFPAGPEWYVNWRRLPDELRNPIRTYTARGARPSEREVDVDFVLHGDGGPASRWVSGARIGDELAIVGPHVEADDPLSGVEWRPGDAQRLLLAGDETAAPAICSILASLPVQAQGHAFIEVPYEGDCDAVQAPDGVTVTWLPRGHARSAHGAALSTAVRGWAAQNLTGRVAPRGVHGAAKAAPGVGAELDIDGGILWEVPQPSAGDGLYAWLAGEAGVIKSLRRLLVSELGVDRARVAFMGYWRAGRAELN